MFWLLWITCDSLGALSEQRVWRNHSTTGGTACRSSQQQHDWRTTRVSRRNRVCNRSSRTRLGVSASFLFYSAAESRSKGWERGGQEEQLQASSFIFKTRWWKTPRPTAEPPPTGASNLTQTKTTLIKAPAPETRGPVTPTSDLRWSEIRGEHHFLHGQHFSCPEGTDDRDATAARPIVSVDNGILPRDRDKAWLCVQVNHSKHSYKWPGHVLPPQK